MTISANHLLVVLPNWVGDAVLATPALRSLRNRYSESKITYLLKPYLAELFGGCPWVDQMLYWPGRKKGFKKQNTLNLLKQLRNEKFDLAVLFANSIRSALMVSLPKIPRRVGYDRDGRGMLLTDKLIPDRYNGRFLPVSAVKYYLSIADYLNCRSDDYRLELFTEPQYEHEVESLFVRHGLDPQKGYAVINPGASFGPSKCWPAENFAAVGDRLVDEYNLTVVVACSSREIPVARKVASAMTRPVVALTDPVIGLGTLKALIKRSAILITNDTGPRHFAPAFGVPVATIFGPTDPRWTETLYVRERQLWEQVECGPCMKRVCPEKHHRCMRLIRPERVLDQVQELLTGEQVRSENELEAR